ncbi:hypothetical protein [Paenibacillus sp. IHBB 3054]|uniref:hypothetical protein n=1 Tax=Paenibacillus sp. IHBB 3054 TaxID=3425689 RepID=UPI003F661FF2
MNKYVNGMREITASTELTEGIVKKAVQEKTESDTGKPALTRRYRLQPAVSIIAAALVLLSLLSLFLIQSNVQRQPGQRPFLSDIFAVTVYAANGEPQQVQPEIKFPIGDYRVTNSRSPGFPIQITADGADEIRLQTTEGSFLRWTPPDYVVHELGTATAIASGDTIYWSPLPSKNRESELTLTAYSNQTEIGRALIRIQSDESGTYSGKLVGNEQQ